MHNAHEFALTTQTWEYVVGLTGLLLFALLWRFLNKPPRKTA